MKSHFLKTNFETSWCIVGDRVQVWPIFSTLFSIGLALSTKVAGKMISSGCKVARAPVSPLNRTRSKTFSGF